VYYRILAAAMRRHGASEADIRGQVEAMMDEVALSGRPPEDLYGSAAEKVARELPGPARRLTLGLAVGMVLFAVVALITIAALTAGPGSRLAGIPPVAISIGGTIIALVVGFFVDHRLPRGLRPQRAPAAP
jgi:hypothetical protein